MQAWHTVQSYSSSVYRPEVVNFATYEITCPELYAAVREHVAHDAQWLYQAQCASNPNGPTVIGSG